MTSAAQALRQTRDALRAGGIDSADLDARLLVEVASGLDRTAILASPEQPLSSSQESALAQLTERRASHEPMAYILGHREFRSLDFAVRAGVLIPRPDTETLIEAVLELAPGARSILDLGVGSGCILLSLLDALPDARGIGVDRSAEALAMAAQNARRLGFAGRAGFLNGDWGTGLDGRFDVVVSNPPYIPSGDIPGLALDVRDFEPVGALDGGPDGLDAYRAIIAQLPRLLEPGGLIAFETGWDQAAGVQALLVAAGLSALSVRQDLAGKDRVVLARVD
jgi:release factor glutamine methyltransferase